MRGLFYLFILCFLFSCNGSKTVKFAVCTDVHQDLIYDATDRMQKFVSAAKKENVDFIIQLGDFCMPFEKNEPFLKTWDSFNGPKYHVLGNHDTDVSPKIVTQQFWGMEKPFYSFDKRAFHFVDMIIIDRYARIEGVHYIGLNSLSYAWVGKKGEYTGRFPKNIEEKYPNLKYTLPYRDAVFAMVKIKTGGKIEIEGIRSNFIQPGPKELGLENTDFSADITSRILEF